MEEAAPVETAPEGADAWLITGSKHGGYDPLPWSAPRCEFVRQTVAARVPLMGFCFGHQLMAEALGGRAEKSAAGWQLGAKTYTATTTMPDWAAPLADAWRLLAVHQDQVTAVPPGATVLAQSPGCRGAMLAYGDVDAPDAISVQPHPEFSPGMVADLITHRLAAIVPEPVVAAARPTLSDPLARTAWRTAVHRYLRLATPAPKDA